MGTPAYPIDTGRSRQIAIGLAGISFGLAHLPASVGLPCPLRSLTGVPCPFCGMTTALRALGGGHVANSLQAAPLGMILVLVVLLMAIRRANPPLRVPVWYLLTPITAEWLYELTRYHVI